jgi:hypothetical protein
MSTGPWQPMTVRAEVWALAAGPDGIYLISGGGQDAWRSRPLGADTDPHWAVQRILRKHGALGSARIIHSTSWRAQDDSVILTYAVVIECPAIAEHWPAAQLVSLLLPEVCGPPLPHGAAAPPVPRMLDVLLHALRHLSFLLAHSATEAAAFSPEWREHLAAFEPALAQMYSEVHKSGVLGPS